MLVIGVDPGLDGAMALLCQRRGLLDCIDLPTCGNGMATGRVTRWLDAQALTENLCAWSAKWELANEAVHAVIERPIAMPSLPATTVASQFDTFGVMRTLLSGTQHLAFVNPREWKHSFGLKTTGKAESRAACLRLYPDAPVTRAKDHNRAEAILIGHHYMRSVA